MTRALRRLDRLDALAGPGDRVVWPGDLRAATGPRDWAPRRRQASPRTSPWWQRHPRMGTVTVLAVVAAAVWGPSSVTALLPARAERPAGVAVPPPGVESAGRRLLPVIAPGDDRAGPFAFVRTRPGTGDPVTFDACRPIHYVVRSGAAGTEGAALVDEAVADVSAATGLAFVPDGSTDEAPSEHRRPYQPDRYGERWAPVLVAWSDPTESPALAGRVAGLGGGHPWPDTHGGLTYVTGTVWLDTPALLGHGRGAAEHAVARGVVIHELAHVLGAAHVTDPRELMFGDEPPASGDRTSPGDRTAARAGRLGPGDRAGLARLGAGPCAPGL